MKEEREESGTIHDGEEQSESSSEGTRWWRKGDYIAFCFDRTGRPQTLPSGVFAALSFDCLCIYIM